MNHFTKLNSLNVNKHTEKKNKLTYLSWAWAWAEIKKVYPASTYRVLKFNGMPYVYDPLTGYMVYTEATIEGLTHEMWLPVMDGANKAMKSEAYTYSVAEWVNGKKTGGTVDKSVEAATMFNVNKTIMRCLTKNLAMFGLGLYIYAGEDIPEDIPKLKTFSDTGFKKMLSMDAVKIAEYLDGKSLKESGYKLNNTQIAELTTRLAVLKAESLDNKAIKEQQSLMPNNK